ncbi:hypothetical protein [Acetonema longum]|uniref:Uncharacterized protein n=1 Tax=Acetonema longum DSM 6540 TaxID=1009370 RepID=F7NEF6_9FIRM|nr:hypothetical protein [Acetonema longum]EGO65367.1 hypothetical protein ALO_02096 [Acetonema longum DSM 6540]
MAEVQDRLKSKYLLAMLAVLWVSGLYHSFSSQAWLVAMASAAAMDYPVQSTTKNFTDKPGIAGEPEAGNEGREQSDTLRLELGKKGLVSEQADHDLSLRLTRKTWQKEVLPGLFFTSGEGFSFKWPNTDLRLYIQRDDGQYQLLWKQNFD